MIGTSDNQDTSGAVAELSTGMNRLSPFDLGMNGGG
jgi:hypothetical protein